MTKKKKQPAITLEELLLALESLSEADLEKVFAVAEKRIKEEEEKEKRRKK